MCNDYKKSTSWPLLQVLPSSIAMPAMGAVSSSTAGCQINGNGDIYGLGVRTGIYLQWATAIITENVHQAEIPATRTAGNCYQTAMLAGLIRISQYPEDDALALEGYIVLLFCFAGVWASASGLQGIGQKKSDSSRPESAQPETPVSGLGTLISLVLNATICAYGTWFLFHGMGRMKRRDEACLETVFFFARTRLFGWVLIVLKVFFVASLAGSALLLIHRLYDMAQNVDVLLGEWDQAPISTDGPRRASQGTQQVLKVTVRAVKLMGSFVAMAMFVTSIELTLRWNHVANVYACDSFSQVFPLVVGAWGFATTVGDLGNKLAMRDMELSMRW